MEEILHEMVKSDRARVIITISEFKGRKYFQVKEQWKSGTDDPDWKYGKKVISFNPDQVEEFIEAIKKIDVEELKKKLT